jgi:hypothetical protein
VGVYPSVFLVNELEVCLVLGFHVSDSFMDCSYFVQRACS